MDVSTELISPGVVESEKVTPDSSRHASPDAGRPAWWAQVVFVGYAWAFALPIWTLIGVLLFVTETLTVESAAAAALLGVVLSAPASIGLRLVNARSGTATGLSLKEVVVATGVSLFWWLPVYLLSTPLTPAAIFVGTGAFLGADHLKRYRNRRRDVRAARRFANPKTLAADQFLDSYLVLEALDSAQTALDDPASARTTLAWVRHQVAQAADRSARAPQPYRVAAGYALKAVELRIAALKLPAAVRVQELKELPTDQFIEPLLLVRLAECALHYAVHHERRSSSELEIGYTKEGESGFAVIRTNSARKDLWFLLPGNSGANAAKLRFVECLNSLAPGERFETGNDGRGNLFFRLSLKDKGASTVSWTEIEGQLPEGATLLSNCPNSEGLNRVYRAGNTVLKVAKHSVGSPKPLSLESEYHVLRRLEGIPGAPQQAEFTAYPAFDVLSYQYVEGTLITEHLKSQDCFRTLASLTLLLEQIHARGVAHRDLMPDNVLVGAHGAVYLIDFDQAVIATPEVAHSVDILGEAREGIYPCRAFTRDLLPALGWSEEYSRVTTDLRALWQRAARSNANSPGQEIAYYQWSFGGLTLSGERPWLQRWQLIRPAIQPLLPGARVLDLGCNMGMLSLHCLLHGAAQVTGVDHEADIVTCAAQLASIAGFELNARHGDLNDSQFVADLAAEPYDLAIALSVVHWLENKSDVMRLLSRTPHVLFEGHLPPTEEMRILREYGFREVRLIGYSERLRGLYLACNK